MKKLLNISQMAILMNMSASQIRFYERKGLLKPARNVQSGYREYSFKEIDDLETIHLLKDLSIPIPVIKSIMDSKDEIAYQEVLKQSETKLEEEISYLEKRLELVRKIQENFEYQHNEEIQVDEYDDRVTTMIDSSLISTATEIDLFNHFEAYNLDYMNYDLALIEIFDNSDQKKYCFYDKYSPREEGIDSYTIKKGQYLSKNIKMKNDNERREIADSFVEECMNLGYELDGNPFIIDYLESKLYSKTYTFGTIQAKLKKN